MGFRLFFKPVSDSASLKAVEALRFPKTDADDAVLPDLTTGPKDSKEEVRALSWRSSGAGRTRGLPGFLFGSGWPLASNRRLLCDPDLDWKISGMNTALGT